MLSSGSEVCMWRAAMLAALCVAVGIVSGGTAAAELLAPWDAGTDELPPVPWAYVGLPGQKPPPTRYAVRDLDGRRMLHVEADRSYGNLVHPLTNVAAGELSWRWRVDAQLPEADLRRKGGDDAALKVCALFDMQRDRVPFVERQLLWLAELRFGQALPNATLCYVWDPSWLRGSVVLNAYTKRVRFITLDGSVGVWHAERHDLAADFLRAFGDESREVPPLRAILVGADADNTGGYSVGWVDALRLGPPAKP